jgi:hypothetical protein
MNGAVQGLTPRTKRIDNGIRQASKSDFPTEAQGSTWAFVYLTLSSLYLARCHIFLFPSDCQTYLCLYGAMPSPPKQGMPLRHIYFVMTKLAMVQL